jgi:hypothetical protein
MKIFVTLLLLYAYFRFFDLHLVAGERLLAYNLRRILFTSHDSLGDPFFRDPVGLAVHPAKTLWAFLRPIVVVAPIYLAQYLSHLAAARFAAIGLIILLGPLGIPAPVPMERTHSRLVMFQASLIRGFNSVIVTLVLSLILYAVQETTGLRVTANWLFIDLHLFPGPAVHPQHPEEIATAAWFVALAMVFARTSVWARGVLSQGLDGLGYPPAAIIPLESDRGRENLLKSIGWGITGFALGWLGLCFAYNYTALLEGYEELGGERTLGLLMVIGLFIGHPF